MAQWALVSAVGDGMGWDGMGEVGVTYGVVLDEGGGRSGGWRGR